MTPTAIASRIKNAHPDHHAIARGMAVGALFVFFSKMLGAAKEMAVAWRYGVSEVVDAYLFLFNIVTWPVAVWFSVLTIVLIPLAASIRADHPARLRGFRAELLGLTLLVGLGMSLAALVGLRLFLNSQATGLNSTAIAAASGMAIPLSFLPIMGVLISLLSTYVMARGGHSNTLLEGVTAAVILFAILLGSAGQPGPLVWGTVIGMMLHLVILAGLLGRRGELEAPKFALRSSYWKPFWKGFGIMLTGQALFSAGSVVDQLFAARLNVGSIATLGYANRIIALIHGLGATAVSRATLPVFSEAQAKQSTDVRRLARRWAQLLFATGCGAMALGLVSAPSVVALLFQRGAFTEHDTQAVVEVLRYALVQTPFFFSGLVFVSLISSTRNYTTLSLVALFGVVIKIIGNTLLVPDMGLNGLVLTSALVYALNTGLMAGATTLGKIRN